LRGLLHRDHRRSRVGDRPGLGVGSRPSQHRVGLLQAPPGLPRQQAGSQPWRGQQQAEASAQFWVPSATAPVTSVIQPGVCATTWPLSPSQAPYRGLIWMSTSSIGGSACIVLRWLTARYRSTVLSLGFCSPPPSRSLTSWASVIGGLPAAR